MEESNWSELSVQLQRNLKKLVLQGFIPSIVEWPHESSD